MLLCLFCAFGAQVLSQESHLPFNPLFQNARSSQEEILSIDSSSSVDSFSFMGDFRFLKKIDVSGMQNADAFLKKLFEENQSLCSLRFINARGTNISLATLKTLRMIQIPYLFRDMSQYSGRFGCHVAGIQVDISDTELSRSEELRYSVIE